MREGVTVVKKCDSPQEVCQLVGRCDGHNLRLDLLSNEWAFDQFLTGPSMIICMWQVDLDLFLHITRNHFRHN